MRTIHAEETQKITQHFFIFIFAPFICLICCSCFCFIFPHFFFDFFPHHSHCLPEQPVFVITGCTSTQKEKRRLGEKSSLEKSVFEWSIEGGEQSSHKPQCSKHSSERKQGSLYKTSTSVRFNQRPLIYHTSFSSSAGVCVPSLSSLYFLSITWFISAEESVSRAISHRSLCVALTDPLHLTAPVWRLLAQRWHLIDGCPNCNYSASLSLAWCEHKRAAG